MTLATLVLKITFDNVDPEQVSPETVAEEIIDLVIDAMNTQQFEYNYDTWNAEWEK
jgi:hypothetical protein